MGFDPSNRRVLLLHEGELADVRALVDQIGAQVVERQGALLAADEETHWDLVVSTPRHLTALRRANKDARAVRIAIVDQESRTLRALLQRSGVDVLVRRPVHASALRLLMLHSLYRGPERRERRVAVGTAVRFRLGMRKRDAILADLSLHGCRLLTSSPVVVGQNLTVFLPELVGQGRAFSVRGKVLRSGVVEVEGGLAHAVAVNFGRLSRGLRKQLGAAVEGFVSGPAVLPKTGAARPASARAPRLERAPEASAAASGARDAAAETVEHADADAGQGGERRTATRRMYGRHVIALGDEAARVLIGRDLSPGGMRVEPTHDLQMNQMLRLALHVSSGETPLVLDARVARDDGERGVLLRFAGIDDEAHRYLAKMMDALPVAETTDGDVSGLVVSEIVDDDAQA